MRNLYRFFDLRTHIVNARRSINSRADKRGLVREVVVLNYDKASEAPARRHTAAARRAAPRAD